GGGGEDRRRGAQDAYEPHRLRYREGADGRRGIQGCVAGPLTSSARRQTCWPPVMWICAPVTLEPFFVHRKKFLSSTTQDRPRRRSGIDSTSLSVPGDRIEVSISPGAIALTRMPCGPKSAAISRLSAASAALEVAYAVPAKGCTRLPTIEVTLTMEPFAVAS